MSYLVFCMVMLVLVACFICCRLIEPGTTALFCKTIASLGMVIGAIIAFTGRVSDFFIFLTIGVVCGMLGDLFIELKKNYIKQDLSYLNAGMIVFGLGHFFYTIAMFKMLPIGYKVTLDVIISVVVALAFSAVLVFVLAKPLKLNFGKAKWQSFAYSVVLTFVMVLSVMLYFRASISLFLPIGFICFLLSDLVLSMQFFGNAKYADAPVFVIANHVLYYGAQVLIIGALY